MNRERWVQEKRETLGPGKRDSREKLQTERRVSSLIVIEGEFDAMVA